MSTYFNKDDLKESPYPTDFIPKGAISIIGVDKANGVDSTVKGFYLNGEYHIQEIIVNEDRL